MSILLAVCYLLWINERGKSGSFSSPTAGEIQSLCIALDQFKAKYGEYPPGDASPQSEVNLAKAVTGRARWEHTPDGKVIWEASTPMSAPLPNWGKPFLDVNKLKVERSANGVLVFNARFLDDWGHPFLYRYKSVDEVINPNSGPNAWKGDGYLLVSRGADGSPADPDANFVWRDTNSKGIIARDYFDAPAGSGRADNATSFILDP